MNDPFNLERFVNAQAGVYEQVCAELRAACKTSHWMWFIFPQIRGLGHSHPAKFFALASIDEAAAYLAHPVLGPRLKECTDLLIQARGHSLQQILGSPDNLKFRSSMTLFSRAATDNAIFIEALERHCSGEPDPVTLQQLGLFHSAVE